MKMFRACFAAFLLAVFAAPVFAAPLAYINTPMDTINQGLNTVIQEYNTNSPLAAYVASCTGTTTATCTGVRIAASYTGLTTAAGATSNAQTVTDTSVTLVSQIFCAVNGYAGAGNPVAVNIVPAAGSFAYQIQNTHASASLNATVVTDCIIYN